MPIKYRVTSDEYNRDAWFLNTRSRTIIDAEVPRKKLAVSAEDAELAYVPLVT